jgi:Helix-turn-helix domain
LGRGADTSRLPFVGGVLSWQAVTWVLEESESTLGSRLVLLSIASHANREGRSAFPSLDTIAKETLLCRREVVYCVQALEESGELFVHRGIGRGNPNNYQLPRVENWLRKVQSLHQLEKKGATQEIKGAIYDNKRCNAISSNTAESTGSSLQPLGTVKEITVKSVLSNLSIPKPPKSKSRANIEEEKAELRRRGFLA